MPPPAAPKPVDLLLTHLCPSSLPLLSAKPLTPPESRTPDVVYSKELDEVAKVARAKYHFVSAPGVFWEREPFEWPAEAGDAPSKTYCRALSLGEMGNKTKDRVSLAGSLTPVWRGDPFPSRGSRCAEIGLGLTSNRAQWFYAFSITPGQTAAAPASSTPSPLHPLRLAEAGSITATMNGTQGPRGLKRPAPADDVNEMGIPNYIFQGVGGAGGALGKKGKGGPPP